MDFVLEKQRMHKNICRKYFEMVGRKPYGGRSDNMAK